MLLLRNFYVNTTAGVDLINVTHEIRSVILEKGAKVAQGWLTVTVPRGGAAVVAMEEGEGGEIRKSLARRTLPDQLCLLPRSLVVPFEQGRMAVEPWQEIFLVDYEGSGKRREFRVQAFWEVKEEKGGRET